MVSQVSKVSIISNALGLLGKAPINDIDNPNLAVQTVLNFYNDILPDLLTSHPWRFAMLTVKLNPLIATPPLDEWSTAYQLPADLLLLYRVVNETNYNVYEDKIYTNTDEAITIDYLFRPAENKFPSYFVTALTYKLAAVSAMPITQTAQIAEFWEKEAEKQVLIARSKDSQFIPNYIVQNDNLFAAHFGRGRARYLR